MNKTHSAGKASRAVFIILKVFGFACYSEIDVKRRIIRSTSLDKAIFVATVCLWTALTYVQIRGKIILDETPQAKESLIQSLWLNLYILQDIFLLIVVTTSFLQRTKIIKIFKKLCDFDQKLSRVSWKAESQEKLFKSAIFLFVIYFVLTIVNAALCINSLWPENQFLDLNDLFYVFNDNLVILSYAALSEQFIVTVFCIRNRLSMMNTNLRYFLVYSRVFK